MALTNNQIIMMTAEEIVKACTVAPSKNFGSLVLEVDNKRMGMLVRRRRELLAIKAVEVAEYMEISRTRVHFLEVGEKAWTGDLLAQYLNAIDALNGD